MTIGVSLTTAARSWKATVKTRWPPPMPIAPKSRCAVAANDAVDVLPVDRGGASPGCGIAWCLRSNGLRLSHGRIPPAPGLSAYFATFVELVGGAALIIGLLTPVVAVLLILDMLGAFFIVHAGSGVFVADGGYELVLALGVGLLLVAVYGAGRFSADAILKLPGARATATAR